MAARPMPALSDKHAMAALPPKIDMLFGEATGELLDLLAALHGRCFDKGWTPASFAQLLGKPGCGLAIASNDGVFVGFIMFQRAEVEAEIVTLAVDPSVRGEGIGKCLVEELADWARQSGVETLFLEVASNNETAIALYRNVGFVENGRRPEYYRIKTTLGSINKVDALCMALRLNSRKTADD